MIKNICSSLILIFFGVTGVTQNMARPSQGPSRLVRHLSCSAPDRDAIEITFDGYGFQSFRANVPMPMQFKVISVNHEQMTYFAQSYYTKQRPAHGILIILNTELSALQIAYDANEPSRLTSFQCHRVHL